MTKKRNFLKAAAWLAVIALVFTACPTSTEPEPETPVVKSITVSTGTGTYLVAKPGTVQFSATVAVSGGASTELSWSLATPNVAAGTSIDEDDGLLTVAAGETSMTLTVKATSTFDTTKSGIITVFVDAFCDDIEVPPESNLYSILNAIKNTPDDYEITLTKDEIDFPGIYFGTPDVNITLKGGAHKITWKLTDSNITSLFRVEEGVSLVLENIQLIRSADVTGSLGIINVRTGGYLEIKSGVTISNSKKDGVGISINGGSVIMSGGTIKDNNNPGIWFGTTSNGASFTMTGGDIIGNGNGISSQGNNNTITIFGGNINNSTLYNGIETQGQNNIIEIKGGTISGNNTNNVNLHAQSTNCTLIISGGTISGAVNNNGISINGKNHTVEIKNGTINGNNHNGIFMGSTDSTLTISGGTISDSVLNNGVGISGENNTVEITDGTISGHKEQGVSLNSIGTDCKLIIKGGTIKDSVLNHGIGINGKNATVEIKGGIISGNTQRGISFSETSENSNLTISGGTITGNGDWGLMARGVNCGFVKQGGGIIYGNNAGDDDKHTNGAIRVQCVNDTTKNLSRLSTAESTDNFAVKTNGTRDGFVGTPEGDWGI